MVTITATTVVIIIIRVTISVSQTPNSIARVQVGRVKGKECGMTRIEILMIKRIF